MSLDIILYLCVCMSMIQFTVDVALRASFAFEVLHTTTTSFILAHAVFCAHVAVIGDASCQGYQHSFFPMGSVGFRLKRWV